MHAKGVVPLYHSSGEISYYRKLSERLPAFLAQYGPQQGYAVFTEVVDSLSLKPGLLRLYETAIQSGRKPEELGLPSALLVGQTQVCRATLQDHSGRVVASATAAKHISGYKDLEVLETAARQRLLAALGFGGEVLDDDEHLDQHDQNLKPQADNRPLVPPSAPPVSTEPSGDLSASAVQPEPVTEDSTESEVVTPPHREEASCEPPASGLVMMRTQIAHLARMRGQDVPVVHSMDEARQMLKQMLQPPMPSALEE